jgi:alpha-L-rhamnosidase
MTPGFNSVKIEPNLGSLNNIDAAMPHKLGMIRVKFQKDKNNHLSGEITLPNKLEGVFMGNGKQIKLKEGLNKID